MNLKKEYNGNKYQIMFAWNGSISWCEVYIYRIFIKFLYIPVWHCNQEYMDEVDKMYPEQIERRLNAGWGKFIKYKEEWKKREEFNI